MMGFIKVVVCPFCGSLKRVFLKRKWKCPKCKMKHFVKDTVWWKGD